MPDQTTLQDLQRLLAEMQGTTSRSRATVRYAGTLTDAQKKALQTAVSSKFPEVKECVFEEASELIAGLQIMYEDYLYDDSLRTRFQRLRQKLLS
ncbi:MAG TPA: F0F1 ATP synthase subunit delta [bacterium]|nr:F0F1 ATP synthase subunit delta [bacterium]